MCWWVYLCCLLADIDAPTESLLGGVSCKDVASKYVTAAVVGLCLVHQIPSVRLFCWLINSLTLACPSLAPHYQMTLHNFSFFWVTLLLIAVDFDRYIIVQTNKM